jgi:hypothetical protein
LSLKNSYETEAGGVEVGSALGVINHIEYPQIVILIKSNLELPNLNIRPFYLNEKIANIFLNFDVKLKDREKFNSKYILESKAEIAKLQKLLSINLTTKIASYEDFSLEIIDANILLKFERDITIEKVMVLYDIASLLDKELTIYSVL